MNSIKKIMLYTDGGTRGNGRDINVGGYGIVAVYSDKPVETFYKGFRNTTNNKMELKAVVDALKNIKDEGYALEVYSDSAYIVNCINNRWFSKWMQNGWITTAKEPVKNRDLWIELINLLERYPFTKFIKVKGHSNDEYNNLADKLANKAMDGMIK